MKFKNKTIRDLVDGKVAEFKCIRSEELWYVTEDGFAFPVPVFELDGAEARRKEKAVFFLKWISRHLREINLGEDTRPRAGQY